MKTLLNPWFILFSGIALFIFTGNRIGLHLPYHTYLNDLLAIPVILNLALAFQRVLIVRSARYCFSIGHVVFTVAYMSLIFEILLPRFKAEFTGDWRDVLLYAAGGVLFWFLMNRPAEK